MPGRFAVKVMLAFDPGATTWLMEYGGSIVKECVSPPADRDSVLM